MWRSAALIVVWCVLLLMALAGPVVLGSTGVGDDRIRYSIRLALACYGLAAALLLTATSDDWQGFTSWLRLARWLWSLAVVTYLVHVAMAFHYYHHWSHTDAYERTARETNFGPGIYISYLFSIVWMLDALFWWIVPQRYARRSPWITGVLHFFLAFTIFNGAVTFAQGAMRWSAVAGFLVLGGLLVRRFLQATMVPICQDRSRS